MTILDMQHALASAHTIRQAARSFAHVARAMKIHVLNPRLHGALSLAPRLGMASGMVANSGQMLPPIANSNSPDSAIDDEPTKRHRTHRPNSSKYSRSESYPPDFKALLGIFSSVYRSLAVSPSGDRQTHRLNPLHRDKPTTDTLADVKQSVAPLLGQLVAPVAPILQRALVRAPQIINEIMQVLKLNSGASKMTNRGLRGLFALFGLETISKLSKGALIEPLVGHARLMPSHSVSFRRLASLGDFTAMLAADRLISYSVLRGIVAAIAGLAFARYELHQHWHGASRLLLRRMQSANNAVDLLMKWIADKIRHAAADARNSITGFAATLPNALRSRAALATTARGLNPARVRRHAAVETRPAPVLRAIVRASVAGTFAGPLILAGAPTRALASPLISTNDTALLAASWLAANRTRGAIVIDYAPNVVIHCGDIADGPALKRRVIEILERHGRELHQVLQREMVRQARRDFQPRYSHR